MTTTQALRAKEYETIYILRSDIDSDTAEKVQGRVGEVVEKGEGKLVKVEAWGRRKLAYPVAKQKRGVYVYLKYVGVGGLVQELERNLKLQDAVLKFQTVVLNEHVDVAAVTVDPEEVKFQKLELPPEDDKEESRERQLGLLDMSSDGPRSRRSEEPEGETAVAGEEPAPASAEAAAKEPAASEAAKDADAKAVPAKDGDAKEEGEA